MVADVPTERIAHLSRCDSEELSARVHTVEPATCELVMQWGLQRHRILAEDKGMDIEPEGHRGIAELTHPVHRIQPTGETYLDHVRAEGSNIGDDVHVAGPDVCFAVLNALDRGLYLGEFTFQHGPILGFAQAGE